MNTNKTKSEKYFQALYNTNGHVKKGEMMAILGESGSGKSTFLSTLSGIVPENAITTGQILFDGKERKLLSWSHKCRLIEQIDTFGNELSVFDMLFYTAQFFNIKEQIPEKITTLLRELRLTHVRNQKTKNLSGGEKKRVAIANALISDPEIVIFDEPTSGLDTKNSLNLVKFLKRLAIERQKIIIVSLHQPGNQIFNLFDKIMLITRGRVVYCDNINACLLTLEAHGFTIDPNSSIHENISEAIDYDERYDEIDSKTQMIEKMTRNVQKLNSDAGKKPNKTTPFNFLVSTNIRHIFYLMTRRFQLQVKNTQFFIGSALSISTFLVFAKIISFNREEGPNENLILGIIFSGLYLLIHFTFILFSFELISPINMEFEEVRAEITHLYYTPTSYYLSIFVFYFLKTVIFNSCLSLIFYAYLPNQIEFKFYLLMTFMPTIYLISQLFIIFISPTRSTSFLLAILLHSPYFIRMLPFPNIFADLPIFLKFYEIVKQNNPIMLFMNVMDSVRWGNMSFASAMKLFAGNNGNPDQITTFFGLENGEIFLSLIFSYLFYFTVGLVALIIKSRPLMRLRVGNK